MEHWSFRAEAQSTARRSLRGAHGSRQASWKVLELSQVEVSLFPSQRSSLMPAQLTGAPWALTWGGCSETPSTVWL